MHLPGRPVDRTAKVLQAIAAFWTSRPILLAVVAGAIATVFAIGGMRALTWMETPEFCGRCHTMQPQVSAHLESPHETVECAECHVSGGLKGLIKSKLSGMQQMIKLITGTYPRPIPPGAHGMPPPTGTCLRCHDPARQRGELLVTRSVFQEDESNSEQRVALVVRLAGDERQETRGIHWHVQSRVEFIASDEEGRKIDWIGVENPDGTSAEFISRDLVEISAQASERAAELRAANGVRRMSCYDCHNRVGHEFLTPSRAVDDAIAEDQLSPDLPFIRKRGLEVISAKYGSLDDAQRAIRELQEAYHRDYPNLFLEMPEAVTRSAQTLADIYERTANPEMHAFAESYPSYLGHTDSAGCFRCHDGGHFKIQDGGLSNEPIPSNCSLCHTFPSVGPRTPNVMLGPAPATHANRLWVFEHKTDAGSGDVTRSSCSSCHSQTYCTNCHSTGATQVQHDNMLFDHGAVIKETGQQACGYCHQKPFCQRCHEEDEPPPAGVREVPR
ncbi:MAG TPA: NapC/NirT family cytochrome c [Dehalococcoidia bacterium]|nr:NapC/NirT family cytochrome c [Dehalococcoidia bacterium]